MSDTVKIKPLVWAQVQSALPREVWESNSILGRFVAWPNGSWKRFGYYGYTVECGSLNSAKAAAQADYDARITAAIAPPADSKAALDRLIAEARAEGMREAAGITDICAKTARDALVNAEGIGARMAWQAAITRAEMIRDSILAAIPAESKAARDRMISDAEVRGMRKAVDGMSGPLWRLILKEEGCFDEPCGIEDCVCRKQHSHILKFAAIQKGGE